LIFLLVVIQVYCHFSMLWLRGLEEDKTRKIHLVNWDKVYLDHEKSGLGVHNVHEFNIALLGK
jgi:hypothetical protein